jgi:K+-sensing histidine kinase KdpD
VLPQAENVELPGDDILLKMAAVDDALTRFEWESNRTALRELRLRLLAQRVPVT